MPDYVTVISGTACDYAAGFEYDVNEVRILSGQNVSEAHEKAKEVLKTLEWKLHLPEIKITRFAPMGLDVNLDACA